MRYVTLTNTFLFFNNKGPCGVLQVAHMIQRAILQLIILNYIPVNFCPQIRFEETKTDNLISK